jgi:two-component system heavy metal sensor histidine kinase CusS
MCSKPADAGPRPPEAPAAPWSITGRLTRYYAAVTTLLLLLAAGYLYWALERTFEVRNRALIGSKVQVMQLLLREYHDKPEVIATEVEHEASSGQPLRYFLRILDVQRQTTVIETSGMATLLPPRVFPAPTPATQPDPVMQPHGLFLLTAVTVNTGVHERAPRTVQVALDLTRQRELIGGFRNRLLVVLVLGVLLAAAAGAWITRHGLRPLVRIAATTRRVTASRLHERVSASHWPAELTALAGEFDAMLDRLEDSFTRLARFSADLAHALRNPINNLRGEAEVALARARTPEEYQQTLASNLEEYERLSRLIDNLLFLARADHPDTALPRVAFAARREMDAVRDFYEALAAEQQVAVECAGEASLLGDPTLFRRAVSNLLANALKHTPAGGRVTIAARPVADGSTEIVVRDTGAGIPREALPRVFDRFFQVDQSRDLTAKGCGLGLAIVQSIMRLHGGTVAIDSELGRGTTVTLRFPGAPMTRT